MYNRLCSVFELIDTLWNVNERGEQDMTVWNVELIDTLWNVNDVIYKGTHAARLELIDTLWNVNADSTKDNEVAYAN